MDIDIFCLYAIQAQTIFEISTQSETTIYRESTKGECMSRSEFAFEHAQTTFFLSVIVVHETKRRHKKKILRKSTPTPEEKFHQ